jgi:flagellar motor switch protein FliM
MKSSTGQHAPSHKFELGRTVIRHEQRIALERIHREVAQQWTRSMTDYLPRGSALEFDDIKLLPLAAVQIDGSSRAQAMMFMFGSRSVAGFLALSGELASFLVAQRLGLKPTQAEDAVPFTRIETAIARETIRTMLARLDEEYRSAGLGNLVGIRECESLADGLGYAPEENLALLRFHLTDQPELHLAVGFASSIIAALSHDGTVHIETHGGREAIANVVARLPIEVDVVLGSWRVPIRELQQLRPGDRVVLPDGQEAWFAARGIRIGRAKVEVTGNRAHLEVVRSVR